MCGVLCVVCCGGLRLWRLSWWSWWSWWTRLRTRRVCPACVQTSSNGSFENQNHQLVTCMRRLLPVATDPWRRRTKSTNHEARKKVGWRTHLIPWLPPSRKDQPFPSHRRWRFLKNLTSTLASGTLACDPEAFHRTFTQRITVSTGLEPTSGVPLVPALLFKHNEQPEVRITKFT